LEVDPVGKRERRERRKPRNPKWKRADPEWIKEEYAEEELVKASEFQ
jgi:hypothetical protein